MPRRDRVCVFSDAHFTPRLVRTIEVPGQAVGDSLTSDGRYLLVAGGGQGGAGAAVLSVARAEAGRSPAVRASEQDTSGGDRRLAWAPVAGARRFRSPRTSR